MGTALAALGALSTLATVLTYVGIALFLAIAVEPALQFVLALRVPRGTAILIFAFGVVALASAVFYAVIPAATAQVSDVVQRLITFFQSMPDQQWFTWLSTQLPSAVDLSGLADQAIGLIGDPDRLLAIGGGLVKIGSGIVDGVTGVLVVTALTVYFIVMLPRIKRKAYMFIAKSKRAEVQPLAEEILQSVGRYVGGQLLLAAINAVFTFILTSAVGVTASALLAVVAFVGALIPVVGTVLGSLVAVLVSFTVSPTAALIVAISMLVYMQVEAYVLAPRVMSKAVAVPGPVVIIAALAGAALAGILGALVAVPIAAAGILIVERVVLPRRELR